MADRPHSRQKGSSQGSGHVSKSDNAAGYGKTGNTSGLHTSPSSSQYNKAPVAQQRTGGRRGSIMPLLIVAVIVFLYFSRSMGSVDTGSSNQSVTSSSGSSQTSIFGGLSGSSYQTPSMSNSGNGWMTTNSSAYNDSSMSQVDRNIDPSAREKYVQLKGSGEDTVTIMVYMCGADLESRSGMATSDLNEMAAANLSDKVNLIVETGGARKWNNSVVSSKTNQRWQVVKGGLKSLDNNVGSKAMTDPETLVDFVKFASSNYHADRYMLIFWDHGGGSVSGYGYDELFPGSTMTIDEISSALKKTGIKYDFVGFDACLMAGMETAMAVEPYADYMIASEETEPGTGWYYTSWLNALSKNSSIETIDLAKILVDDFTAASASASSRAKTTLSIIDLAEFKGVIPSVLGAFGQNLSSQIKSDNYQQVAQARSDTREFASSSHIDQIDLVNFCNNLGTNEALDLAKAVSGCVKYNKTYNVTNAYGMSVYFPYSSLKSVNNMVKIYDNLEVDDSYAESIKSFAQLESAGQIVTSQTSGSTGLFDVLMGGSSSTGSAAGGSIESILLQALMSGGSSGITSSSGGSAGYGSALTSFASILGGSQAGATAQADSLASLLGARAPITEEDLQLTNEGGRVILKLAEDKWQEIDTVAINVFVDDGHGYIDMGLDNIASYDDDGDLIVDYDGDWLAVNGNMAAYYLSSDDYDEESGYYVTNGYIPAELNGERVNLLIEFSEKDPDGTILGAQKVYKNEETGEVTQAKGLIEPKDGDTLRLLCDYYKPDGSFDDSYYLGEPIEVSGEGLELMTLTMDNDKVYYNYRLTDYYGSNYWTPLRELAR